MTAVREAPIVLVRGFVLVSAAAGLLLAGGEAGAEPFLTRNQNPLLALYGLPSPLPARLPEPGRGRMAAVVNWGNSASVEGSGPSRLTLDAETIDVRFHVEHSIRPSWALRAELPWRRISAGSLDAFIDDWHELFGLPNGSRDQLPRDQLLIDYRVDDVTRLLVDESASGLGDVPLSVGRQWLASDTRALAGWLTIKLPVGDADDLSGSGAVDAALSLAYQARIHDDWELFGQLNAAWLGDGDLLPQQQESSAWSALAGVTWNAWRALDLTLQFEANSRIFSGGGDTNLSGDAVVLTFGGSYRTTGGWQFDLGISEDVEVSASPDVVFILGLRRDF